MPRSWACKDPNPNKPDLTLLRDEPSRLKTGINIEKQKPQCITLSCGLSFILSYTLYISNFIHV